MHYTGTIWRPPYEASSLLIEVTAGCTHHRCKFCTLYHDLPFQFRMSPLEDVEADLKEAQKQFRLWNNYQVSRTFLTGANPFALQFDRLITIADLIHKYFPKNKTIGCFSRVTEHLTKNRRGIASPAPSRLRWPHQLELKPATIRPLQFMHKGYQSADILTQCKRLDRAGIRYHFFYLTGISGAARRQGQSNR